MVQFVRGELASNQLKSIFMARLMTKRHHPEMGAKRRNSQRGFTLVEVLMAIVILLVGIVAVAQLVPASISSNSANRNDSTSLWCLRSGRWTNS